jgi:membrane-bound serine protease (ClpP class)
VRPLTLRAVHRNVGASWRTRVIRGIASGIVLAAALGTGASAASSPAPAESSGATGSKAATKPSSNGVNVIEVTGYIDPIMKRFVLESLDKAASDKVEALVIVMNSPGSLLKPKEFDALEAAVRDETRVPVAVWVGPLGARAMGGAARLAAAADVIGMAPSTKIGRSTGTSDPFVGRVYRQEEAVKAKLIQSNAPVLVQFVGELDGQKVNGRTLDTAFPATEANGKRTAKVNAVRFAKLNLLDRLLHTAANPSVAYLLFVIALALFVFEFFTGGIGIAAGVGLGAFVLAIAGLGTLPTRPLGVILILIAMLGFAIDVQAGAPRFWTGVGTLGLVAGSLTLFASGVRVPIYMIALMVLMTVLFMVNGMPTMVRTRFATPTIGREAMIGEIGTATSAVEPEGVVTVLGAPWRARTNRATPIGAGANVRVVAVDGLLLEVEPLEGGAKDAGH